MIRTAPMAVTASTMHTRLKVTTQPIIPPFQAR